MSQSNEIVPFLFGQSNSVRVVMLHGEPWFFAQDVAQILGYSATGAMNKIIDEDDRQNWTIQYGTTYKKQSLINEPGLYQAIFGSELPDAKKFKKWVTSEVLPSIRKTGGYSTAGIPALSTHTRREIQISNSKQVNHVLMEQGGRDAIIGYNIKNCALQSGKLPDEWKKIGKKEGLPSKLRASAKEVLRVKAPQVACGMSLADQLVSGGAQTDDGISIGKDSQPIFERILALGITPPELLL